MRFFKWLFLGVFTLCLVTLALANAEVVTLRLLPDEFAAMAGIPNAIRLPLYLILMGAIALGLILGYLGEWIREHKQRSEGKRAKRDANALEREVKRMRRDGGSGGDDDDDLIALLDGPGR